MLVTSLHHIPWPTFYCNSLSLSRDALWKRLPDTARKNTDWLRVLREPELVVRRSSSEV